MEATNTRPQPTTALPDAAGDGAATLINGCTDVSLLEKAAPPLKTGGVSAVTSVVAELPGTKAARSSLPDGEEEAKATAHDDQDGDNDVDKHNSANEAVQAATGIHRGKTRALYTRSDKRLHLPVGGRDVAAIRVPVGLVWTQPAAC